MKKWRKLLCICIAAGSVAAQVQAEPTETRAAEIAAWQAFLEHVEKAGARILSEHRPPSEIDRAEGVLYLAQQLSYVIDGILIERQDAFPLLRVQATTIDKWGLDSADAKYTSASIESDGVYRLYGRLGDAQVIAIQLAKAAPEFEAYGSLLADEFGADASGRFEIMLSRQRPEGWDGPWLQMHPDTTDLLVRQYFADWESERPSQMMLERVDYVEAAPPLTVPAAVYLLEAMADRFVNRSTMWIPWVMNTRRTLVNQLQPLVGNDQGLKHDRVYGEGWFQITPDQALVIELAAPKAEMWSFQLGNYWWESIDYVSGTGSINGHQAVPGGDGRYRLVISLQDPGVPNWLDPAGHTEGAIMYRYQKTTTAPVPKATLVSLDELDEFLPGDTPTVTPEERRAQIESRRAHAHRRWAP